MDRAAEIVRRCQLSVISFQLDQKAKLTAARYCTVSVVEPEMPSRFAEIFAVPFPLVYAIPLRVTTAIAGFDAVHCTYGVAICVVESLNVTVAVKDCPRPSITAASVSGEESAAIDSRSVLNGKQVL